MRKQPVIRREEARLQGENGTAPGSGGSQLKGFAVALALRLVMCITAYILLRSPPLQMPGVFLRKSKK